MPSLGFTPIVNKSSGSGVVWAHTLGIDGQPHFTYLGEPPQLSIKGHETVGKHPINGRD